MRNLLILCFVLLACACAKVSPTAPPKVIPVAGLNEAQQCLRDLRKLQAAANIGTNQLNYDPLLIEAKASCDEAGRKLPDGRLKIEINEAIRAYIDASTLWSSWKDIRPSDSPYSGWKVKYGIKENVQKYNEPIPMTVVSFDPHECVPVIWDYAAKHLDEAGRLLDSAIQN